jgi:hypothetical protein
VLTGFNSAVLALDAMDDPTQQTEGREIVYARHAHFTPPHLSKQHFVTVFEGDALVILNEVNAHLFSEYDYSCPSIT